MWHDTKKKEYYPFCPQLLYQRPLSPLNLLSFPYCALYFNFFLILPLPSSPHKPFSTQLRTVTTIFTFLSQLNSLFPLLVDSKNSYKEVVIASNLYICIRPSMSKFQLILIQCYWYISFLNTPINLAVMAKKSRSQGVFYLALLKNTTNTFIESFLHNVLFSKALSILEQRF